MDANKFMTGVSAVGTEGGEGMTLIHTFYPCWPPYLHRWMDAGKFMTGFSAVGSIAIPAILAHAQVGREGRVKGRGRGRVSQG